MKKNYRYLFIFIFLVSSFLIFVDVNALEYEATVLNADGAKCSLRSNSTGYCFYQDSSFTSVTQGVLWLDTGDKVTVITGKDIASPDTNLCPDKYVYTKYNSLKYGEKYGYYCNYYLKSGSFLTDELREEFTKEGFPESYFESLAYLKTAHPNWNFKAIKTGLKFSDAVNGEISIPGHSLVQTSASNNYAYFSISSQSFDYYNDKFIEYDQIGGSNPWCEANYETVAYYMDPRNFLTDMHIFQFEGLSYDSSISEETYQSLIIQIFKNDYLSNYVSDFLEAGKQAKMSPVYLASLSKQEVGIGLEASTAIAGTYNGMYNFYNIGATGGESPAINGLNFAAKSDTSTLRPWNTPNKAIVGGAIWMNDKYISVGQDTSYFKKWNVIYNYLISTGKVSDPYTNFYHQYMTNIMAPSSEATTTYRSYSNSGLLNTGFIFYIPVYENMPSSTILPTTGGWPNNYLSSISINDTQVAEFDGAVETYNYYLDINTTEINISASAVSNKAQVSGIGKFEITENTTKEIKVTAENGNVKTYKINIILTGEKVEESIDVITTLNNAGIKNGDKYISGLTVESEVSVIENKIKNANKDAIVKFTNSGIVSTGNKLTITVGSEIKTYEMVVYGDANGDGAIDARDYVRIRKYIMSTANLSGAYYEASDVNKDGAVDARDYVKIRKYIMGTSGIEQ